MLDVFLTIDVEIWCDGWNDIDRKFPDAFRRYIYGPTRQGKFGLPYHLEMLRSHGLRGVFFIESLFSTRFGLEPLAEIIDLVKSGKQELQLHLHPEWVNEAKQPLLDKVGPRRRYLRDFSLKEQTVLIAEGRKLMASAGASNVNAFRAGGFGLNRDTIRALALNGITFDSSYNASRSLSASDILPGTKIVEPTVIDGVYEYPMTVFDDRTRRLRHAQITACSYRELESMLWAAVDAERKAFIILSHNFELLNSSRTRPDRVVIRRYERLCAFLDRHRDCFRAQGFERLEPRVANQQPDPLISNLWRTAGRTIEQIYGRLRQ